MYATQQLIDALAEICRVSPERLLDTLYVASVLSKHSVEVYKQVLYILTFDPMPEQRLVRLFYRTIMAILTPHLYVPFSLAVFWDGDRLRFMFPKKVKERIQQLPLQEEVVELLLGRAVTYDTQRPVQISNAVSDSTTSDELDTESQCKLRERLHDALQQLVDAVERNDVLSVHRQCYVILTIILCLQRDWHLQYDVYCILDEFRLRIGHIAASMDLTCMKYRRELVRLFVEECIARFGLPKVQFIATKESGKGEETSESQSETGSNIE